ncbi:hypothetical protein CDAR_567511 [Caerostris darwini]|uniref:Uncharacterized protein n=1 Tax=Caerostris darwini TaxID=1538125 RepID=A0AAV4QWJ2_9ARAC|nr:hypothetical protein CDAR_567511 [Caerostris darwini]
MVRHNRVWSDPFHKQIIRMFHSHFKSWNSHLKCSSSRLTTRTRSPPSSPDKRKKIMIMPPPLQATKERGSGIGGGCGSYNYPASRTFRSCSHPLTSLRK